MAAQQRQAVQAQKAEYARLLSEQFLKILSLHRVEFPPAARPITPSAQPPDRAAIYQHYEQHALNGIGFLQRAARADGKQKAAAWTEAEVQRQWTAACEQQAQWQQYFDQRWQLLCANDPDVVLETLNEAFEDNEAPSAAVGVSDTEASIVLLVPSVDRVVPEQMPTTTQAGNLSLKKLPQRDRADYYKLFVAGQMLVTVREALAVAPNLKSARIVALRNEGADAYGNPRVTCLLAARFERSALDGVQWQTADAARILNDISTDRLINQKGRSSELAALDLSAEPALHELLKAVDLEELISDA